MTIIRRWMTGSVWTFDYSAEIILPFKIHSDEFIVEVIPLANSPLAFLNLLGIGFDVIV
jgi:hypothetical protein